MGESEAVNVEAGREAGEPAQETLPMPVGAARAVDVRRASVALPTERRPAIPAVQAAAVAAGSFVAGAAVAGLVHRRGRRGSAPAKATRGGRRAARSGPRGAAELVQIVSSRSLLVDVHLLGGLGER